MTLDEIRTAKDKLESDLFEAMKGPIEAFSTATGCPVVAIDLHVTRFFNFDGSGVASLTSVGCDIDVGL